MILRTAGILLLLLLPFVASAAHPPRKIVQAVRTNTPPKIDGVVNEAQWKDASAVLDFEQFDPIEGARPTEITSVRILYDNHALYVGVICYDSRPDQIVRQLSRRDRSTEADRFTVMIDSYFDRQSAFVFTTNVSGVQSDGVLSQEGVVYDISWDAVWKVGTTVYRDGWSAEFEVPFNELRFAETDSGEHSWGINFRRYISRKRETVEWVMVPRSEMLQIPLWGTLTGIRSIDPPLHLDLVPYISGSATILSATEGRERSTRTDMLGGVDAKYGLTRNFTLDATFNPDFGQVEVDRAVLNLTVFETLYPEKRPFFIEGARFFAFGLGVDNAPLPMFFPRRIGKRPTGYPSLLAPPGGQIVSNPSVTTILGAAKVSGRTASGLSVGILTSLTGEEEATLEDSTGQEYTQRTEPQGSYHVLRVKQEFGGDSWLGAMGTLATRSSMVPAYAGGLDWNLRFGNGTHSLDGYVAAARSSGGGEQASGTAGRLLLSRISAEHWFYYGAYDFFSRSFDINDLGFFARPHDHGGYLQVKYLETNAGGLLHWYEINAVPEGRWNWDGLLTLAQMEVRPALELANFWRLDPAYTVKGPAFTDEEYGIIGTYRRPAAHQFVLRVRSDARKSVVGDMTALTELDTKGKLAAAIALEIVLRPAPWFEIAPSLFWQSVRDEEAGIFTGGTIASVQIGTRWYSLFADRTVDELDLGLRGILTFTRKVSLQFFTQILVARGTYTNTRALIGSNGFAPYETPPGLYDFSGLTFNANVLLRWEYLPGSAMYLVWTQQRIGDMGDSGAGLDALLGDAFFLPHEDLVLLKVSYWLPL